MSKNVKSSMAWGIIVMGQSRVAIKSTSAESEL